jgi:hypothetical protein
LYEQHITAESKELLRARKVTPDPFNFSIASLLRWAVEWRTLFLLQDATAASRGEVAFLRRYERRLLVAPRSLDTDLLILLFHHCVCYFYFL